MEDFERSPSPIEIRTATYLGWVHGSSGILFFEHASAPDSVYGRVPSSNTLWAECERLTVEGAQLSAALHESLRWQTLQFRAHVN